MNAIKVRLLEGVSRMITHHQQGLLARLRRQGAVAVVMILVFVFGAATQAYARGLQGPDEEMCLSAVSQSQTQTSGGATAPSRHDGSCCDVCVCAFPAALAAPAATPPAFPGQARRLRRARLPASIAPRRRVLRPRLRGPPAI